MSDYETYYHDKDRLKKAAKLLIPEPLDLDATTDLVSLRNILAKNYNMDTCCFLDSCTAERFFRIDRAQEQLHYVTDVAAEVVYILEESSPGQGVPTVETEITTACQEPETAHPSPSEERPREKPAMTKAGPPPTSDQPSAKQQEETNHLPKTQRENEQPTGQQQQQQQASSTNAEANSRSETEQLSPPPPPPAASVNLGKEVDNLSQKSVNVGTRKKTKEEMKENDDERKQTTSKQDGNSSKSITGSNVNRSADQTSHTFISPRDRLFGLSSEVHTFSTGLLEKTSDGILKAAKIGDLAALKELHNKGYSLLSIDTTGQTALHLASRYGHKNIVRYLIASAPPTILDIADNDKGQTALHKAAQYKKRSICCMLVAGGANLTVKDRHGQTPRQLALLAEDRELAAYLQSQEQFQLAVEE